MHVEGRRTRAKMSETFTGHTILVGICKKKNSSVPDNTLVAPVKSGQRFNLGELLSKVQKVIEGSSSAPDDLLPIQSASRLSIG